MSTTSPNPEPDPISLKRKQAPSSKRYTEAQKRAMVGAVMAGESIISVSKRFGMNRTLLGQLVRSVKAVPGSALNADWRKKLNADLPSQSVDAIERSVTDLNDVHKAAATAVAHLKGIGVFASEATTQVSVLVSGVQNLPADWREAYFTASEPELTTTTSSGCTPGEGENNGKSG